MAKVAFTAGRVNGFACPPDKAQAFLWDSTAKGLGLRVTPAGKPAYVFQAVYQDKTIRVTIGSPGVWTIPLAQEKARELQRLIDEGKDPRSLKADAIAQTKAKAAAKATQLKNQTYTLEKLLDAYCDYLKSLNRISYGAAQSIFRVHVIEAWPDVASLPANAVSSEQIADMMRRTIQNGKDRTANKLRSYLRAAYQVAKAARSKPSIPVTFKAFNITSNPAADTEPDESANRADKNPLNAEEMRSYWQSIKILPGMAGSVLRLHLLTGGQRIEQLCNLTTADITPDAITLHDGKGRPGKGPRPHTVPLIDAAAAALRECNPMGAYAISMNGGKSRLGERTISDWACAAGVGIDGFQAKRIRSGVETLLASARISADTRGRLQSHGISGVQARHYDGHHYLDEKREALETLFTLLEGSSNNVIQLRVA
jgi:integrase